MKTMNKVEAALLTRRLQDLLGEQESILAAVVATHDGFEVAYAQRQGALSPARVAAMASSLQALGGSMAVETSSGECTDIIINGTRGRLLVRDIVDAQAPLLLCVQTTSEAVLGSILFAVRSCMTDVAAILNRAHH
jgi:uncharacterized protein